jgi:hypothetical protein
MSFTIRGFASPCAWALLLTVAPSGVLAQMVVSGRVREELSGRGVATADVALADSLGENAGRAITGPQGRFSFAHPGPGTYELSVGRIGYFDSFVTIELRGDVSAEIDFSLAPRPLELEPIMVAASRYAEARGLALRGFATRRRRGLGDFVVRDDLELRVASNLSDVFVGRIGVQMRDGDVRFTGTGRLTGDCLPAIWVDGFLMRRAALGGYTLDQVAPSPRDIEGIEWYRRASSIPVEFNVDGACGVVVIWTR